MFTGPMENVQGYSLAHLYQFKEQTMNVYTIIPSLPIMILIVVMMTELRQQLAKAGS